MEIETLAVHSGLMVDPATGSVSPPIHMSTTFQRDADGTYPQGYIYSRSNNPTRKLLEECVRDLEAGEAAASFSSGMAAIMSIFQTLSAGDHVIAPRDAYHGTAHLLKTVLSRWNLMTSFVDMTDLDELRKEMGPSTKLVFVETPSNPLLKITDISKVADIAHQRGAYCVCDNTWATPVLQMPINLGADLAVHSSTKYLGGHGDVMGGVVVSAHDDDLFRKLRQVQQDGGAVPSPFDCWLLLRSIRTLPYRIRAQSENAAKLAVFLTEHPGISEVFYPGLASRPGHETAQRQMRMFGGMLSFRVIGGRERAFAVAAKTTLFTQATSLGSYESLIERRASVEGPDSATPDDLLRVSVGLENINDLIADLEQALTS